jgi:linoleoyl-CoA desaturase
MYFKIAMLLAWMVLSYVLLVFVTATWWQGLLLAFSLGLAIAGTAFNLGHDGGHGSISRVPFINRLLAMTFDFLGASSYIWHFKHNIFHHSYPNILGADEDIDGDPLARLSPHQPQRWIHRFQYLYMWVLYGFLPLKWQFMDDFICMAWGRIAQNRFPRPRGWQLWYFFLGKAVFLSWTLVLPLLFHSLWIVLCCYLVTSHILGLTLSVIFQLAHATEQADFPAISGAAPRCDNEWAVHQVQSTVDFRPGQPHPELVPWRPQLSD